MNLIILLVIIIIILLVFQHILSMKHCLQILECVQFFSAMAVIKFLNQANDTRRGEVESIPRRRLNPAGAVLVGRPHCSRGESDITHESPLSLGHA